MNAITSLKLFEITQEFIKDKDKTKQFISILEETIDNKYNEHQNNIVTREELNKGLSELKIQIESVQSSLLKWMFAMFFPFYVGMIVFLIKQFF